VPKVKKIIDLVFLRFGGKKKMKKAFTLLELTVAVGLLAMMILFASMIFNVSIDTYRMATANAEIMQKLQAITSQLTADFKGLRKDGEIFVVWVTSPAGAGDNDYDHDGFIRFDRIMFFADGDFQSYGASPVIRGNLARISYMLARTKDKDGNWIRAQLQDPDKRILARTQHILTADTGLADSLNLGTFDNQKWSEWHNWFEYDKILLDAWKNISDRDKQDMLTIITDVSVGLLESTPLRVGDDWRGAKVDTADANSIHMLLCEGVGEFKVQGWYAAEQRWVPEVDNGDFYDPSTNQVPGVLYPRFVSINKDPYLGPVDEAHFDMIPGLGRALKFTFTLYDSKGIIKNGKTFTHIVYLGE